HHPEAPQAPAGARTRAPAHGARAGRTDRRGRRGCGRDPRARHLNYERAEISARLGRIFRIRFELYQRKFMVKFLNNFLAQVTPFLFYTLGGYLVIAGRLDIGALVAVIAAYKDLPAPVKELIDWDQQRMDVEIKYNQVVEQFTAEEVSA